MFGCSPGVYPRVDLSNLRGWFELHRWEPGIIGKPDTQKPWFSPEYVQWMKQLPPHVNLWMNDTYPDVPNGKRLPIENLIARFGSYFFTSSVAMMMACAIEDILERRAEIAKRAEVLPDDHLPDVIGLWGVDMAATEEYGYQRAGCQYFVTIAALLNIQIYVPPESDLLRPMPVYGFVENEWFHIKNTQRLRELTSRRDQARNAMAGAQSQMAFLDGAIDDMNYQMQTWGGDRDGVGIEPALLANSPALKQLLAPKAQPVLLGELGPQGQIPGAVVLPPEAGKQPAAKKVIRRGTSIERARRR